MLQHMALKIVALSAVIIIGLIAVFVWVASSPLPVQDFMHNSLQMGNEDAQTISVSVDQAS